MTHTNLEGWLVSYRRVLVLPVPVLPFRKRIAGVTKRNCIPGIAFKYDCVSASMGTSTAKRLRSGSISVNSRFVMWSVFVMDDTKKLCARDVSVVACLNRSSCECRTWNPLFSQ